MVAVMAANPSRSTGLVYQMGCDGLDILMNISIQRKSNRCEDLAADVSELISLKTLCHGKGAVAAFDVRQTSTR